MLKNTPDSAGEAGLIPRWEDPLKKERGNPLHYSCLGNLMDRGASRAIVHEVAKSWARLSNKPTAKTNTFVIFSDSHGNSRDFHGKV